LDLRAVVKKVAGDWRRVIADHELDLAEILPDHDLFVAGDRPSLDRLLNILLDNAVKYTPPKGKIEIKLDQNKQGATLAVRDTGIGISDADQPRIFERFYRADKARSREMGGAGLGLAIAHWIVGQHGGSISVKSSPGHGSVFVVTFPR
jgi:signal transduction histidine kinase